MEPGNVMVQLAQMHTHGSILQLNDDIITLIFEQLNMRDRLRTIICGRSIYRKLRYIHSPFSRNISIDMFFWTERVSALDNKHRPQRMANDDLFFPLLYTWFFRGMEEIENVRFYGCKAVSILENLQACKRDSISKFLLKEVRMHSSIVTTLHRRCATLRVASTTNTDWDSDQVMHIMEPKGNIAAITAPCIAAMQLAAALVVLLDRLYILYRSIINQVPVLFDMNPGENLQPAVDECWGYLGKETKIALGRFLGADRVVLKEEAREGVRAQFEKELSGLFRMREQQDPFFEGHPNLCWHNFLRMRRRLFVSGLLDRSIVEAERGEIQQQCQFYEHRVSTPKGRMLQETARSGTVRTASPTSSDPMNLFAFLRSLCLNRESKESFYFAQGCPCHH